MTSPTLPPTNEAEAAFNERIEAVTESIRKYHDYIEGYLYQLTRHTQDAENLAQEVWIYVLTHFKDEQIGSLALIRRKAYHLFIDHYRKNIRRNEVDTEEMPEPTSYVSQEAYTDAEETALRDKFWSEYPDVALSNQQKEVFWLHARYGFTYKEISKQTGVAHSTISDWVGTARERLIEANTIKPVGFTK